MIMFNKKLKVVFGYDPTVWLVMVSSFLKTTIMGMICLIDQFMVNTLTLTFFCLRFKRFFDNGCLVHSFNIL